MRFLIRSKSFLLGCFIIASLFNVSPVNLSLWQFNSDGLQTVNWQNGLPVDATPKQLAASLKIDHGSVTLSSPAGEWHSPDDWFVKQAAWTDLNHDNQPEVTLLVERPFEPWPVDRVLPHGGRIQTHQDAGGMSSHIILMGWKHDQWGEIWAGSALARPVRMFKTADLDQDGIQELVVLEGTYQDEKTSLASSLAVWKWDGFGFELVTRLERPISNFTVAYTRQKTALILLQ